MVPGCGLPSASEMTYIVSSGALNSTHSLTVDCPVHQEADALNETLSLYSPQPVQMIAE